MGAIEKAIVNFGFKADGTGVFAGHPSIFERLNVGLIPRAEADWTGAPAPFPAGSTVALERAAEKLNVPRRFAGEGPVNAISIAADSPIEACDVYIGGATGACHRIGIGCPLVGAIDENTQILVAPIRDLPAPLRREFITGAISGDRQIRETSFWEMPLQISPTDQPIMTMPLRLNLYRGSGLPILVHRAQYSANMIFQVLDIGAGVPSVPALNVIVDGRRRVRVVAGIWDGAGAASLTVHGIEGRSGHISGTNPTGIIDWPVFDELMAATALTAIPTPLIFDYTDGNPYFAFTAAIAAGATVGTRGYISIHAWDD